ncbi:DUF4012 domain-containing protein [Bifidobacterium eulemuris]|uniref:DUF4012 domain-containing protein n=1 Tax=Bifidobacterium eulemuris TaxID=1765219 RepID=A0A261GAX1_9BIFI|nr:DUF4012 domain-containing protein [Bifidobacterium eulemuris]OZG68568.1 hypothetical protein BEUL_0878 [Bifidobacterium eulemuris]QOL32697.1 DUF4012 domain-containing protein [Bifidobacterium eulemuris]
MTFNNDGDNLFDGLTDAPMARMEPPTPPSASESSPSARSSGDGNPGGQHRSRRASQRRLRERRRKRNRRILIAVAVVLGVLIALGAWFGISGLKAKNEVEQAVAAVSQIQTSVSGGDMDQAVSGLNDLADHIDAAYQQTNSPIWALASWMPYVGSDIGAVRSVVGALETVSTDALPSLSSALDGFSLDSISVQNGQVQIGDLASRATDLTTASEVISQANDELQAVDGMRIEQLANAVDSAKTQFNTVSSLLDTVSRAAQLLPKMLGLEDGQTRNYLLISQNNAELRTTGGIPGSWGVITVSNGAISVSEFDSASKVSETPVVELTGEEKVLFGEYLAEYQQDINFTPDFPRSAYIGTVMWKLLKNQDVDGVISVDPVALQRMLAVTGGMTMSDGTVLDGQNTVQTLLRDSYVRFDTQTTQDAFFALAAQEVFEHVTHTSGNNTELIKALSGAVTDGHIMLWSAHEDEQEVLAGTTIAGELENDPTEPVAGLYFNDLTQGKMDWYLEREVSLEYEKTYPNGERQYALHVKLTNTAPTDAATSLPELVRGYWNGEPRSGEIETTTYVYAPAGGRLVSWEFDGSGVDDSEFDTLSVHEGLTYGSKTVTLQPGESCEFTIHVSSSSEAEGKEITLRQTPTLE